jgi:pimeloyl-ACP methyl ester carboxylesterase
MTQPTSGQASAVPRRPRRALRRIGWIAATLLVLYFVGIPLGAAVVLKVLLTPGGVDWSQSNNPNPPTDPLVINYRGDPKTAFGFDFKTITFPTELGDAEAWLVPAANPSPVWALYVHGIGGLRENGYRQLSILHEAGIPTLLITYRNDKGAPASPNNLYSFGLTEWRDADSAIDWMVAQGAQKIVLVAESMGGAIAGQLLMHSAHTDRIAAIALDAPALDFATVLRDPLERLHLPFADTLVSLALRATRVLTGTDLSGLDSRAAVIAYPGPLFLSQGTADMLVPPSIAREVAAQRTAPTFYLETSGNHLRSFELEPEKYREDFLAMLQQLKQ